MPTPIEVASPEFIQQDIINIKTLLYALRGVLADDIKNGDEIENIDSLESEELISVACVIEKLSENVTNKSEDEEENGGSVRDITSKAIRQTIKENEDLKRQNILLEQKLEEKERKIKALERVLVTEEKSYGMLSYLKKTSYVNSASQTDRANVRASSLDRSHSIHNPSSISRSRSIRELEECRKLPSSSSSSPLKMLPPARASASASSNISSLREKLAAVKTVSSSSGHLASPVTPRRRFLMQPNEQRSTNESAMLGLSANQRTSLSSSPYTSSSSSTSYLLSPRPVRSKNSSDACQSSADSRHGWLYTQSSFKFSNRAFKPTIL